MAILTINAGSSSIKYKMYTQNLIPLFNGLIEGIGETRGFWHHTSQEKTSNEHRFASHKEAFLQLATTLQTLLQNEPIVGIGHRVVHGGKDYYEPSIITPKLLNTIRELSSLAPIHNPINVEGIIFAQNCFPDALQVAVFDTGFHHSLPESVYRYAIDKDLTDSLNIRRYGFHGINHAYVAAEAAGYLNKPLTSCDFITLHLGNGASACLIKNGLSFDTTMGMTPLPGLIMGTRCGDIDPSIALYLQRKGLSIQEVDNLFNKNSGLKGIAKDNDMRRLSVRAEAGDADANLAIEMYVYAIQKTIGAYLSQTSSLNALIFTGGVGENASIIRKKIIAPLRHLGLAINADIQPTQACEKISSIGIPILVIRGDEEKYIATAVLAFYNQ
jgi:acetate kinase